MAARIAIKWNAEGATLVARGEKVSRHESRVRFERSDDDQYDLAIAIDGNSERAMGYQADKLAWCPATPSEFGKEFDLGSADAFFKKINGQWTKS